MNSGITFLTILALINVGYYTRDRSLQLAAGIVLVALGVAQFG